VAMESIGVYWRPVFNILEGNFQVILINAQRYRTVPGRKGDVKDCTWLAQLLKHGLLRASVIPPHSRAARADPLSQAADPRAGEQDRASAQAAVVGQSQAGAGGHQHHRCLGVGDPASPGRWGWGWSCPGRAGERGAVAQARGDGWDPGAGGRDPTPSAVIIYS
jgi:hypothetical protein